MESLIILVAIFFTVQSPGCASLASIAPSVGDATLISTTQATENQTDISVSVSFQRTSRTETADYNTKTTASSLEGRTNAHSEQHLTEGFINSTRSAALTTLNSDTVSRSQSDVTPRIEERTTNSPTYDLSTQSVRLDSYTRQSLTTTDIPPPTSLHGAESESSTGTIGPGNLATEIATPSERNYDVTSGAWTSSPGESSGGYGVAASELTLLSTDQPGSTRTDGTGVTSGPASGTTVAATRTGNTTVASTVQDELATTTSLEHLSTGVYTTPSDTMGPAFSFLTTDLGLLTDVAGIEETVSPDGNILITDVTNVTDLQTDQADYMQTELNTQPADVLTDSSRSDLSTAMLMATGETPSPVSPFRTELTTLLDELLTDAETFTSLPASTAVSHDVSTATVSGVEEVELTTIIVTEIVTDLTTDDVIEGTPVELWTVEEETEVIGTDLGTDLGVTEVDDHTTWTDPTTTQEISAVVPVPCLCNLSVAELSARVCLCNSSLALSNYTYRAMLIRQNPANASSPTSPLPNQLVTAEGGCWNISVPLGGAYRIVVTASDGLGNNASTPSDYFYSGLMPPYLSIGKAAGESPSIEAFWEFPYPTYVDYITIFVSRDDGPNTALTTLPILGVQSADSFTFFAGRLGSKYTVVVVVYSGNESMMSNADAVIIAPPMPEAISVSRVTTDQISLEWPHRVAACPTCTFLVEYRQARPLYGNPRPIRLHIVCPSLLPAYPARLRGPTAAGATNKCTAAVRDLVPGVLYTIDVYATSYEVLSKNAAQLQERTLPAPPRNVTITTVTAHSISVSWLPGEGYHTRYQLHAQAQPRYSEEVGSVPAHSTDFTFHNLLAGTRYIISIAARADSKEGMMVEVGKTTSPIEPGPVDQLRVEALVSLHQVRVWFLAPVWSNGVIRGYQIKYMGIREAGSQVCSSGDKYLPDYQTSAIIDQLKGGCNYTFTVRAENEVGFGPSASASILTKTGVPTVPESTPPYPASTTIKSTGFTVTFDPSLFDDAKGQISHIIVIVAESVDTDGPNRGNSSAMETLPTWAEAVTNDVIPPYQTSEPLALRDLLSARRRRSVEESKSTIEIEIGAEHCSREEKDVYCNGPLPQGRSYVYRFRGISPGGYADTKYSLPVLLPVSPHSIIIGISTALFSLLVIVIILSIVIIVRKFRLDGRGRYQPASMKDVELTRVATSHAASTNNKQKYSRPVPLTDFNRDWFSMTADSNYGFSQEYEAIRKVGKKLTTNVAVSASNVGKNRYTNILPYDRTRVKLSPVDDEDGSDYINANYIPGFSSPREYIACQGPLPGTTEDMWRMVWEQNINTVVMVTQLVEKGKVKCDQYWPDDHKPVLYGDIQVTMTQTIEEEDWNIKEFVLQKRDQRHHVRHWNFLSWPDHGVPESSNALLSFIKRIRGTNPPSTSPMAVHCSAGVGRTGTFIVLDRLLQHMDQYDFVDVMGAVCEMRMHRNFMVQTEQQYVFIHRSLMDVIEERSLVPVPIGGSLP